MGKALSSPEDCVRLQMFAYRLEEHHIRLFVCLNALKWTQAGPGRFSRASISILVSLSLFSRTTLFDRISLEKIDHDGFRRIGAV